MNKRVFQGKCVVCGKRTYLNADGSGDPRGALGLRAWDGLVAKDYGCKGVDVPMCWGCGQDEHTHERALSVAKAQWSKCAL